VALFKITPQDIRREDFSYIVSSYGFLKVLKNLDSERIQINPNSLLTDIEAFKAFFDEPIEAIHAFYSIVACWDVTSTIIETPNGELAVLGFKGKKISEPVHIASKYTKSFTRFVETHYVFTNEGSGLTVDYYFSRFDEVLAALDPEYVRQHRIFFTDDNLSKFALWFVERYFFGRHTEESLNDYIVFDPAGGSGNLVTSWRGHLRHKIVSELQPDLLKVIEKRMRQDPYHIETGFTIIPKTVTNQGLNFLDRAADDYMTEIERVLAEKSLRMDKPLAFLLNPPYKSTDENEDNRADKAANYGVHASITAHTGEDAAKERYLTFVAQILNICQRQVQQSPELQPLLLIFTPTSWLIPRPTYVPFRKVFDAHFQYEDGFVVTSNEFFKLQGRWPVAFTLWRYQPDPTRQNHVTVRDLTNLTARQLFRFDWNTPAELLDGLLEPVMEKAQAVNLGEKRITVKEWVNQSMYDFKRDPTQAELKSKEVYGGLPFKDERRKNKKTYGIADSSFIGFMDDCTPVRIKQDSQNRMSNDSDRVWFRLDNDFKSINKTRILNGAPDKYGYCAYDLASAQVTFGWFAMTKVFNGNYPLWANQFDLWMPNFDSNPNVAERFYALSFAFGLAENRCVVTKFEANNPVEDAPEVLVENPLCPTLSRSFWSSALQPFLDGIPHNTAPEARVLVKKIRHLYDLWNRDYCHGQWLYEVGLKEEAYFRYFAYEDFLTPHSGLIQIRKYAEIHGETTLLTAFEDISVATRTVREALYTLLVEELGYFQ
jgi:hypothetical protein